MAQGALMIEDDHRLAKAIEHFDPRPSYEVF
jgi:hypothetical protein